MYEIGKQYQSFLTDVKKCAQKYGREESSVQLIAVSKRHSASQVKALLELGQTAFAENQVQEAIDKIKVLSGLSIDWHFIGHIQSNKTKAIAEHFSWVQSVCSKKQAQRLNDQRPVHLAPINICIQLNLTGEATKSGICVDELLSLARFISGLPKLTLRGVMAIPMRLDDLQAQRKQFADVRKAFELLKKDYPDVDVLSMGMSGDYQAAIAEGATMIRIGTALFGE